MVRIGSLTAALAIASAIALGAGALPAGGEEATVRIVSPVTGQGLYVEIGMNQARVLGALRGILYVESGPDTLGGSRIVCATSFSIDTLSPAYTAEGQCTIGHGEEHKVFTQWTCVGTLLKACRGRLTVTGGTGRFTGITGEGEAFLRMATAEFIELPKEQRGGIGLVRQLGEGLLTLPAFRYRLP